MKEFKNLKTINESEKKIIDCPKCDGTGVLKHYGHVQGGVCFKCGGSGKIKVSKNYKPTQSEYYFGFIFTQDNKWSRYFKFKTTSEKQAVKKIINDFNKRKDFPIFKNIKNPEIFIISESELEIKPSLENTEVFELVKQNRGVIIKI